MYMPVFPFGSCDFFVVIDVFFFLSFYKVFLIVGLFLLIIFVKLVIECEVTEKFVCLQDISTRPIHAHQCYVKVSLYPVFSFSFGYTDIIYFT